MGNIMRKLRLPPGRAVPLPAAEDAGALAVSRARDAETKALTEEIIQAELKDIAKSIRNFGVFVDRLEQLQANPDLSTLPSAKEDGACDAELKAITEEMMQAQLKDVVQSIRKYGILAARLEQEGHAIAKAFPATIQEMKKLRDVPIEA